MENNQNSRRKFIQQTALAGAVLILVNPLDILAQNKNSNYMSKNIRSKGYTGKDENGKLESCNFERRTVGENDVLIEIKYSGICHSDIHTIKAIGVNKSICKFQDMRLQGSSPLLAKIKCESCENGEEHHSET